MTPQQLKAMKLALEALKTSMYPQQKQLQAIASLEETLAEHAMRETQRLGQEIEQEPVFTYEQVKAHIQVAMMSTTPPQRKPLTDEQMKKIWYAMQNIMGWYSFQEIARAIEAAHGIKENT